MGNCSSEFKGPKAAIKKHSRVALKGVKTPDELPEEALIGGTPSNDVFKDFYWYLTSFQLQRTESEVMKDWRPNPYLPWDGRMHGTVDGMSAVVNSVRGDPGRTKKYQTKCHDAKWRKAVRSWLAKQGIRLQFDFEPSSEVEHAAHQRMGLYLKGYSFSATIVDPCLEGSYTTASSVSSTSLPTTGKMQSSTFTNASSPQGLSKLALSSSE
eukprot:TRINITY_DN5691_c3_g1_i1.p1 TRINITY_DN5691_c3_g1~~TRINITY_DN5691_c3_g1_i1.p1  ORF type:complete len:229 (+),score=29.80 TRINITY_DN5691_c3_g1_i1:57-689(+)